jgi:hypothetical protein
MTVPWAVQAHAVAAKVDPENCNLLLASPAFSNRHNNNAAGQSGAPSHKMRLPRRGILPVDLGPHDENIRVNPIKIRPVEGCRELQHVDPVCQADIGIGIPVAANGQFRLSAALDAGIMFPRRKVGGAPPARHLPMSSSRPKACSEPSGLTTRHKLK